MLYISTICAPTFNAWKQYSNIYLAYPLQLHNPAPQTPPSTTPPPHSRTTWSSFRVFCVCVCLYAGVANIVRGNPFIQVEHSGILVCTRLHCVPWLTPRQFPSRIAALRFVCLFTRGSTRYSGANPPLAHCVAYLCGGARAATLRLSDSARASASAYICANGKWRMRMEHSRGRW